MVRHRFIFWVKTKNPSPRNFLCTAAQIRRGEKFLHAAAPGQNQTRGVKSAVVKNFYAPKIFWRK
jgi:hypothetical protein